MNCKTEESRLPMKKLDLNTVAEKFEMIDSKMHLFYNTETEEVDFFGNSMNSDDADAEKFEDAAWISAPSQRDINEYDMMMDFAESVSDSHNNELLCVALEGKGAFRRFKDTLYRVDLEDEWYAFKRKAYMEIAREWCEENNIAYTSGTKMHEPEVTSITQDSENKVGNLLDKLSKEKLIHFLVEYAKDDAKFANAILVRFSKPEYQEELTKIENEIDNALDGVSDYRNHDSWGYADFDVKDIITEITQRVRQGHIRLASFGTVLPLCLKVLQAQRQHHFGQITLNT